MQPIPGYDWYIPDSRDIAMRFEDSRLHSVSAPHLRSMWINCYSGQVLAGLDNNDRDKPLFVSTMLCSCDLDVAPRRNNKGCHSSDQSMADLCGARKSRCCRKLAEYVVGTIYLGYMQVITTG